MSMNQTPPPRSAQEVLKLKRPMSVAIYDDYRDAAHAVDFLADRQFPVETLAIVGTDLKSVEKVTGNLTWGRVLLSGFLQGSAWAGMFAIFMWMFVPGMNLLNALALGLAGFGLVGMAMAAIQYRMRGGERDYTSTTAIIATHYEVLAEADNVDRARNLLTGGAAHQTRPTEAYPPAQSVVPAAPANEVDLSRLPPPAWPGTENQASVSPPSATAADTANALPPPAAAGPQPGGASQQPYGQFWGEQDAPGIGDLPKNFEPPKRGDESGQAGQQVNDERQPPSA